MFQSLFLWNSRPDPTPPKEGRLSIVAVSILVFVELAPGRHTGNGSIDADRFQSLFLWNSRPDFEPSSVPATLMLCFNPCFCGTRARTRPIRVKRASIRCFNPCFCGTRARTAPQVPGPHLGRSFNPCFCGTRARTSNESRPSRRSSSFNPCFCGTRARTASFPSSRSSPGGFQSLFLWNSRPDLRYHELLLPIRRVSILVFVELAPGPRPNC